MTATLPPGPVLTIGIPTRNRARFLARAIASALLSRSPDVEVLVSDNASTDDTENVARRFESDGYPVRYQRHAEDIGFDANFQSVVRASRGRYLWCLGDDDKIEDGGVEQALSLIREHAQIGGITFEANGYSVDGQLVEVCDSSRSVVVFEGTSAALTHPKFLHRLANLTLHVFRTDLARQVLASHVLPANGCSAHHLMLRILASDHGWLWTDIPAAGWTYGNDSFMNNGLLARARLALTAYSSNLRSVFGEDSPAVNVWERHHLVPLARQYVLRAKNVSYAVQHCRPYRCGSRERWKIAWLTGRHLARHLGFWTRVLPTIIAPRTAIELAASLRRHTRDTLARRA